jgi:hypothetical protein
MEKIIDIVRDNVARFDWASEGVLYYKVETERYIYHFPVDMNNKEDVGTANFESEHKAINLMRYLRKALENLEKIKNDSGTIGKRH